MKRTAVLPALALTVALVLTLTACGAGSTDPGSAGSVPGRPTTTLVPTTDTVAVFVWFTRGERVEAVRRPVPKVARIGAEAMKALIGGPTEDERRSGLSTAIPAGTQFRDLTIDNGLARVDLSRTFESGGGTLGLTLRLAQVACTLDSFDSVTGVRFALDGQLVDVISGDGIVVDKPVTCDSYREVTAQPTGPGRLFPGIWPYTTYPELEAYDKGADQAYRDPANTAKLFADRYLGFTNAQASAFRSTGLGAGEVPVGFGTQPTTVVQVRQLGREGAGGPWAVVSAASADIEVTAPAGGGAKVASPLAVTGRARTFEGNVVVEVREDAMVARQSIGKGNVTGRGDGVLGPFSGTIAFRAPSKPAGAVVFYEPSAMDGGTLRATVVRVAF